MTAARDAMTALMAPRSVAVVGATERAGASSSYVMRNLIARCFSGAILPVNPRGGMVFGYPAAPSISALGSPADVVVIGVAADRVLGALSEAAEAGIKAAVVLASGFAELDAAGRARQDELAALAKRHGMAVCGPNCLGLFNVHSGAALCSTTLSPDIRKGGLAFVSHSGAGAVAFANTRRLGFSHIVSSGNSATTDLADYIAYLAEDGATSVIGVFLEAMRAPEAFARAMAKAHAAGKPVIALRAGRTAGGQRATAAHTGALAGSNEAHASFFRRHGVIEAGDMDEFIEIATLCSSLRQRPARPGVAVIGVSGGGVAHVADIAAEAGLTLPDFAPDTIVRLKALLPAFATPQNPLDTTGIVFADASIYTSALEAIAADPCVGIIVAAQDAPTGLDAAGAAEYLGIAGAVADFASTSATPTVFMSNLSSGHHDSVAGRADAGAIVLNGTRAALRAIAQILLPRPILPAGQPQSEVSADPRWLAMLSDGTRLTERDAKAFLAAHGFAVTREAIATSADEAASAAQAIGCPVAMKIESPDLPHKTEAGGVRLGIHDAGEARAAFIEIMRAAAAFAPQAELRGVVVQEMVAGGVEALVGLTRHEPFGLGIVVGCGGVLVELMADAAFELLPVDEATARAMVARTKLARLLAGYRGAPAADLEALVRTIVALSDLAVVYGGQIEAIDLNPVAVLPVGRGVRILDALVIPSGRSMIRLK